MKCFCNILIQQHYIQDGHKNTRRENEAKEREAFDRDRASSLRPGEIPGEVPGEVLPGSRMRSWAVA